MYSIQGALVRFWYFGMSNKNVNNSESTQKEDLKSNNMYHILRLLTVAHLR